MRTLLLAALLLAGCATTGRYTGDEYFYDDAGEHWSCREPAAWKGGNCMPEHAWPDGGVDGE